MKTLLLHGIPALEPTIELKRLAEHAEVQPDTYTQYQLVDDLIALKRERTKERKAASRLFFAIGLFLAMLFVTFLFEWKSYETNTIVEINLVDEPIDELLEIPPTEHQPPPPPQKIQQPNIVEVVDEEVIEEEIKVDFDIEITTDEVMEEVDYSALEIEVPEEKADEVFSIVETMPAPQGGMQEFMKFLHSNIKYPNKALNAKVQGKVFVQFIVNPDGKLSDFEVVKGIGMGCDEEAVRVLQAAPAWSPGKQRGKPVHVKMVLPVNFVYKSR